MESSRHTIRCFKRRRMGQLVTIRRIKLYPRMTQNQHYIQSHPRTIELWGSPTPDVTDNFDSWIFLGKFNSIKPSGLDRITSRDVEYARRGEEYYTTENTNVPVRYVRFHISETWGKPVHTVQVMEIEFFGTIQDK